MAKKKKKQLCCLTYNIVRFYVSFMFPWLQHRLQLKCLAFGIQSHAVLNSRSMIQYYRIRTTSIAMSFFIKRFQTVQRAAIINITNFV